MSGASARQAEHQLAPKVSQTGCPRNEANEICLPSAVVAVKSWAGLPTTGAEPDPPPVRVTAVSPVSSVADRRSTT